MRTRLQESVRVYAVSLGCPKNRVDTEHLLGSLGCACEMVEELRDAELVFINTCGFIEPAVRESLAAIFDVIEELKDCERRPFLAVAGCLVGRYGAKTLTEELPEVDLFLETGEMKDWPAKISRALLGHERTKTGRLFSPGSYAWLKIGEGCRHHCAFCTIPSIRGGLASESVDFLCREAKQLIAGGVREIDLVAQDVTSYGRDQGKECRGLKELLERLVELDLLWLRLLYLYPAGLTNDLLRYFESLGAPFLPYFDIPLQHAHPEVLKRMGRPFAEDPRTVLDRVRSVFPHAAIRTTMIVGFPGESEAQFEYLCRFVEESRFHHLGVFCYEREEGTKAFGFDGQIDKETAKGRRSQLMQIQQEITSDLLSDCVGKTMTVLVDSARAEWPGLHNGRVWFQAPEVDGQTYISGPNVVSGREIQAEIVEHNVYDLTALA